MSEPVNNNLNEAGENKVINNTLKIDASGILNGSLWNKKNQEDKIKYSEHFDKYDLKGKFFSLMVSNLASDMYTVSGYDLGLKKSGEIFGEKKMGKLTNEKIKEFIDSILSEKQKIEFEKNLELDLSYTWKDDNGKNYRFRINVFHQAQNPSSCVRYLREDIKSLEDLGFPPIVKLLSERNSGIVLVCGVTGSGKSTTITGMIDNINTNFSKHIISIEDPVEYIFEKKKSWIEQREVGTDSHSFATAMKSALRQNPDILFLGEMRDLESISSALSMAESGHLVFSTIHAKNSMQCITKITDAFPGDKQNLVRSQLSEGIAGIITQKLVKKKDGTGLKLVMEIMINNTAVSSVIRENNLHQLESIIQMNKMSGMVLLDESILAAVSSGDISGEEAINTSNSPETIGKILSDNGYI